MSHFAIKISKKKARKHRHSVFSLYISGLEKNQGKVEERDSAQEIGCLFHLSRRSSMSYGLLSRISL